jgi:DNA-binding NarL/FixJ family response regulator
VERIQELERGRKAYASRAWPDAYDALVSADRSEPLGPEDLELLATAASMMGHEVEFLELLERAYRRHMEADDSVAALRCAFWIGVSLAQAGEPARAGGWLGRAERLLARAGGDRVERGYLVLASMFEQEARGDWEAAVESAAEAASIGERFRDPDLFALAAHEQGHVLIEHGRGRDGMRLLDEAMLAVTTGELSPIVSGIVYCGVILACQEAFEVARAAEWTAALTRWCDGQPGLVSFTGRCMVHRAELLQLRGEWPDALDEAREAVSRCRQGENEAAAGEARYRQGEIHRLSGELEAAAEAYADARQSGREPQPGLALLWLAQGKRGAALAAIRRALAETPEPGRRLGLLPAHVDIALAAREPAEAREASRELERIAKGYQGPVPEATAAQSRGALELTRGNAREALTALRRAERRWREVEAPYEAARARELIGLACRALGDEDTAAMELDAARQAFERLGAAADTSRLEATIAATPGTHGLSERELEVLRLLASGQTNKAIAADLVLSVRTVDRHVSNIFAKLGVSSRAAATAYAHQHGLV